MVEELHTGVTVRCAQCHDYPCRCFVTFCPSADCQMMHGTGMNVRSIHWL